MNNIHAALYDALHGLDIAIVGGDPRDVQITRLQHDFALNRVVHCPTRQADPSPRAFEAALHRPGVVLAVWLCGLSRTNHGRQLRAICGSLSLPWLNCPRIPHPNQLAALVNERHLLNAIIRRRSYLTSTSSTEGGR